MEDYISFNDFKYERPNVDEVTEAFHVQTERLHRAGNVEEQCQAIDDLNRVRKTVYSMQNLAIIRLKQNTENSFYTEEDVFWNKFKPVFAELETMFYQAMLQSEYLDILKERYSKQIFDYAENCLASYAPCIKEEIIQENTLVSQSIRLAAGITEYEGKKVSLPQLPMLFGNSDRNIRRKAFEAWQNYYVQKESEYDQMFDEMRRLRQMKAKKLGFENYVSLGYHQQQRIGYTIDDVVKFRDAVKESIVPVASKIREAQCRRINLDQLMYYDEEVMFQEDMPKPKFHSEQEFKEIAAKAMDRFGAPCREYWDFLKNSDLLDLYARQHKASGGMAYYVHEHNAPYIFTNLDSTFSAVEVLAHELGHGLQLYLSGDTAMPELFYPTPDCCEIHAMTMELFNYRNYDLFFDGDINKAIYAHLASTLAKIPYYCLGDEFQQVIYENPDISAEGCKKAWRELERQYLPWRNYGEDSFFSKGTFWYKQNHILMSPFYYIEYAFAQISAYQFWLQQQKDEEAAWSNYLKICRVGGTMSFLDELKSVGYRSPFEKGLIDEIVPQLEKYLDKLI